MDTNDHARRSRIEDVSNATSDDDDLVTIAIPPDKPVGEALERVEEDHAEAEYLDADETSRGLRKALGRARHLLHGYDRTPENGLAVYAGVVDGETVEYVFDELPAPVPEFTYRRSNEFDADPLDAVGGSTETYGLLVVERGGAAIGLLEDDRVATVETVESQVMGKTRAGGQSAQRFARERERQKREFFETVAAEVERAFLDDGRDAGGDRTTGAAASVDVDGLLVGGTTITVEEFLDGEFLDHRLRERVVGGSFPVEYASEQGLRQLADRAREHVVDEEKRAAREFLDRFRESLRSDDGEVAYGREAVEEALTYDAVETVLVSEALPADEIRAYEDRASEEGGDCVVVPTDIERGRRFHEAFGGVAALLRFPVE